MILIDKAQANNVITTLELTEDYVTIIYSFENFQSKQVITIPIEVVEAIVNNERYFEVQFTEQQSNTLIEGNADYKIFATSASVKDLTYIDELETIIDTTGMIVLEIGKALIRGQEEVTTTYQTDNTAIVYENLQGN